MVEGERGLDQGGHARRGNRVSDHRLDRPHRAAGQLTLAFPEHPREGLDLDHVADRVSPSRAPRRARSSSGRDAGGGVGAPQRELLPLHPWRHHAHPPPVARHADPTDHGVHAVAVADSVLDPLEHDRADALAEQRAVGVLVEGPELLIPRQRPQPAEQVHRRHRHPHLRAAGESEVAVAGEQIPHRVLDRHERGGTGRVDGVGGTHQVETVRDPPDDDVGDQAGDGFGPERRQHLLQLAPQQLEVGLRAVGLRAGAEGRSSGRRRACAGLRSRCRR